MRRGMGLRLAAMLVALACVAGMTACGGDDDGGGGGGGSGGPTTLKVGVIPIADVAPLYLGIEEGLLQGAAAHHRAAAGRGRRGDHARRGQRQLPDRLLEHDLAADRRLAGTCRSRSSARACWAARARRRPGPTCSCSRTGRSRSRRTSRARRSRSTRSTTSARSRSRRRWRRRAWTCRQAQVRRGAVPRHERRAGGQARRRRLRGRALRQPGQGRQGDAASTPSTSTRRPT